MLSTKLRHFTPLHQLRNRIVTFSLFGCAAFSCEKHCDYCGCSVGNFTIVKARPKRAPNTSEYMLMALPMLSSQYLMICYCVRGWGLDRYLASSATGMPICEVWRLLMSEVQTRVGATSLGRCADISSAAAPCDKWFQSRLRALDLTLTTGQAQPMEKMRSNKA